MQSEKYSLVLGKWLERAQDWRGARSRFLDSFREQNTFSADRMIASANMFDILPPTAVPAGVPLSEGLTTARDTCRKIFKQLPDGPERNSVLGALGRVGGASLKQKIRHRSRPLSDAMGDLFPDLSMVTDEAVECRNYYVHGTHDRPHFDYSENFDVSIFFIETLEFVFAATDLIETRWDVRYWSTRETSMTHPFGAYRINYATNLKRLKAILTRR
jgi:hypothetical protein